MSPFDLILSAAEGIDGPALVEMPPAVPVVKDFDPSCEKLGFLLNEGEDGTLRLLDLPSRNGVHVEVNGRRVVTLMGCVAGDIPADCLTFEAA